VSGRWDLIIRDNKSNSTRKQTFDAVLVCTGHHADKNVPAFPGQEICKGKVIHTHDYRNMSGFEGKKIVVVGIGNSGGDISVELSRIASQVIKKVANFYLKLYVPEYGREITQIIAIYV